MARVSCSRLFLVGAALAAASPCVAEVSHAAPAALVTSTQGPQPLDWLKSGNYSALDSYYSQRQQVYEAGGITDEELYASFRKLYEDSPANERFFTGWVEAYPGSYSAVLARGAYLYRMAWAVRGDNYINDIPAGQIEAMKSLLARARLDLSASLTRTDKPYLSTLYLLNVAMLNGTAAERRQWFERGTSIDPNSSLVRVRYMFSLRPRWGGSYREMRGFLKQCEEQNLPPRLIARLNMLIHADLAEDAMRTADNQKILDEWQQVIELASAAGEEPSTEALIGFTRAAQDLNRPMDVQRGLNLLEGRSPTDAWSQGRLGWIYIQAHQDDKAWTFLTRAAGQNDPWAQFVLGHSIYDGVATLHKAPDQQAGLAWIRRSAEQCFPDAVRFLEARGEKPSQECKRRASAKHEWWLVLLPALGTLIPGLLAALARANRKRTVASIDHPDRMHYPPGALAVGLLSLGLALALASLSMLHDNAAADPIFGAVPLLLGVLGVSILVAYYRVWHELTAEGLNFGRLLGRRCSLKWSDVTRITYSGTLRWFYIETASGEHVRISAMLTGLPEFARAVLRNVPSYAIDGTTREALQAHAQGELPSLA